MLTVKRWKKPEIQYDVLGQVKKKKIGNKPGAAAGTALANLDFKYNIRGWLLTVNKTYVGNAPNADQYFGMQLGNDKNATLSTFLPQMGLKKKIKLQFLIALVIEDQEMWKYVMLTLQKPKMS